MKLTTLRTLLLPVSLLALGAVSASAAPVNCNTITTLAQAIATDFNATPGCIDANILFSNFSFDFTSGTSNSGPNPQTPSATQVAFHITDDGLGDYSIITDFTNSVPKFAVTANNTMAFELQYKATELKASTTITDVAGSANEGIRTNSPSPSGRFIKTECANGVYSDTGGSNPSPLDSCSTTESSVQNSTWNQSQANAGDPTIIANQSNQAHDIDTTSQHLLSVGIYDNARLNGGSTDVPSGGYQAAVGTIENDLTETTTVSGTPEPGTFLLLGGALVGLGVIRRRKAA